MRCWWDSELFPLAGGLAAAFSKFN